MKSRSTFFCLLFIMTFTAASCAASNEVVKVKKGDLRVTLEPEGDFIPAEPVELNFWPEAYEGALRIEEVIENGKAVKKGDVLVRFETEPIKELIANKELDLQTGKMNLEDARMALTMLGVEMDLALRAAQNNAKWAKKNRDAYVQTEIPLDEDEHKHGRQGTLDRIQDQKEEIEQLGKMYSEDELTEETEEIVLRRAKRRLERTIKGLELGDRRRKYSLDTERPKKLEDLELDVRSKEQALEKVQVTQKNQKALKEVELRKTELGVEKQTGELEKLRRDLEKFVICSPGDGILYHGEADAEEQKILKVKDLCKPYTTLLTIAKPGEVKARCMITEKDIFRLRPNMPAKIKPVALPGVELSGLLEPLGLLPGKDNQWKAVVELQDTNARLIPRMKCKTEIPLEVIKNVLIVPRSVVFEKDGKKICYVKKDDGYEFRQVDVGKTGGKNIEIRKGLKAGEEVFLKEPDKDEEKKEP